MLNGNVPLLLLPFFLGASRPLKIFRLSEFCFVLVSIKHNKEKSCDVNLKPDMVGNY